MKKKIAGLIHKMHTKYFLKKKFFKLHKFLFNISINGMGINNCTGNLSEEKNLLKRLFQQNDEIVIFDVGANQGDFSFFLTANYPNAVIHAFEPHPITFSKLSEAIKRDNVFLNNNACGDKIGITTLYDFKNRESTSLATLYEESLINLRNTHTIKFEVELDTIDNYVIKNKIEHIDLLKIDVEGNELKVLIGAVNSLKQDKFDYILFEFNDIHVYSRTFFRDFVELLTDFKLFRLLPNDLLEVDYYKFPILFEIFSYQNILAVRKSSNKQILS
jgi:FkbM family methyltransferase